MSPKPSPQGLLPLTVSAIETLVPQGQVKLPSLVSPTHITILQGAPAQQNAPLLTENAQQVLHVYVATMPPLALGTLTTTGNLHPCNMPLTG